MCIYHTITTTNTTLYIIPATTTTTNNNNDKHIDDNNDNNNNDDIELCHLYPYPCPKKFYKLPAVLFCCTILFYKVAWAWAWV